MDLKQFTNVKGIADELKFSDYNKNVNFKFSDITLRASNFFYIFKTPSTSSRIFSQQMATNGAM